MQSLQKASGQKQLLMAIPLGFGKHFRVAVSSSIIGVFALIVVGATLTAGLLPFHVPKNDVAWVTDLNAIRFGDHGTILSTSPLELSGSEGSAAAVELWVQPSRVWATGCILALVNLQHGRQFTIEQEYTDLVIRVEALKGSRPISGLRVPNVFRSAQAFLTVVSDDHHTDVYVDGKLELRSTDLQLSARDFSGDMIIANSPYRDHSWSGQIKGLAFYAGALQPSQVVEDYRGWTERGHPDYDAPAKAQALYLFGEHSGNAVQSAISSGPNLAIPNQFVVVDHLIFELPASEYRTQPGYLNSVILNVAGFVPLGFAVSLYFSTVWDRRRAGLLAVFTGTVVSFTIECLQFFIPTRFSGVTDLFTNTFGSFVGVMLCSWLVLRRATLATQASPRLHH